MNLYAALDVASGNVIADLTERHRADEFRRFLNLIDRLVPDDLDVHVIVDNSSIHKTPENQRSPVPPPFHAALHADLQLLDEPRRAVVRRAHEQVAPVWHASIDQEARGGDQLMDRHLERQPTPLRLAQDSR